MAAGLLPRRPRSQCLPPHHAAAVYAACSLHVSLPCPLLPRSLKLLSALLAGADARAEFQPQERELETLDTAELHHQKQCSVPCRVACMLGGPHGRDQEGACGATWYRLTKMSCDQVDSLAPKTWQKRSAARPPESSRCIHMLTGGRALGWCTACRALVHLRHLRPLAQVRQPQPGPAGTKSPKTRGSAPLSPSTPRTPASGHLRMNMSRWLPLAQAFRMRRPFFVRICGNLWQNAVLQTATAGPLYTLRVIVLACMLTGTFMTRLHTCPLPWRCTHPGRGVCHAGRGACGDCWARGECMAAALGIFGSLRPGNYDCLAKLLTFAKAVTSSTVHLLICLCHSLVLQPGGSTQVRGSHTTVKPRLVVATSCS